MRFLDRGFGFIAPSDGGPEIFFHISSFHRNIEPAEGDAVSYQISQRFDGRPKAVRVEIDLKDGQ